LLNSGEYLAGIAADLVASLIAESVARLLHSSISELADREGTRTTNRYSPGYCSWSVGEQQKLFKQFPEGFCGITLSPSSLMAPIKSVSGIIGLGNHVSYREYDCDACQVKHCAARNHRITKGGAIY
jgi:cobalamin-dependent methionine synthase I